MAKQVTSQTPAAQMPNYGDVDTSSLNTNQPTPIGVEKGSFAHVRNPFRPQATGWQPPRTNQPAYVNVPPKYFAGDEWAPASYDPDTMMKLQDQMQQAGLYTGKYVRGSWGSADAAAYTELLTQANASGQDSSATLSRIMAAPKVDTTPKQPLTVVLSNTQDLHDTIHQVGNALYGGNLPDSTVQAITDAVHAQETAAQTDAYNMGSTGGTMELGQGVGAGGMMTSDSAKNLIDDTIKKDHPNEVAATQFSNMFDNIIGSLTNNQSGYGGVKYP